MMRPRFYYLLFFCQVLLSCSTTTSYDTPLVEIEDVQYLDYKQEAHFGSLKLTPVSYTRSAFDYEHSIIASFLYQGMVASIQIDINHLEHTMQLRSLGTESDYFVEAAAALYQVELSNAAMHDCLPCSYYDGEPDERNLNKQAVDIKIGCKNEVAEVDFDGRLSIDLPNNEITLSTQYADLTKERFIRTLMSAAEE